MGWGFGSSRVGFGAVVNYQSSQGKDSVSLFPLPLYHAHFLRQSAALSNATLHLV